MPHNKNLEVPELKTKTDGNCIFTHNHANNYNFKFKDEMPTDDERKSCHVFLRKVKKK